MSPDMNLGPVANLGRVAGIDCGTNSIRLLIADRDGRRLNEVHREMRVVRLGQGVDATGRFAPNALERTRVALQDYADLLRRFVASASCSRVASVAAQCS